MMNAKGRFVHLSLMGISIALAVFTALQKLHPSWSVPLAVGIALCTDFLGLIKDPAAGAGSQPTKLMALLLFSGLMLAVNASCAHPGQPGTGSKLIDCASQDVAKRGPEALPKVNECLASGLTDISSCLAALIDGVTITVEIIACDVQHEGRAARDAMERNSADMVDAHRLARSKEYLQKLKDQGYSFQ